MIYSSFLLSIFSNKVFISSFTIILSSSLHIPVVFKTSPVLGFEKVYLFEALPYIDLSVWLVINAINKSSFIS